MTNPNLSKLTESENDVLRFVLAFVLLPSSRLKLSKSERETLETAQTKLNFQDW